MIQNVSITNWSGHILSKFNYQIFDIKDWLHTPTRLILYFSTLLLSEYIYMKHKLIFFKILLYLHCKQKLYKIKNYILIKSLIQLKKLEHSWQGRYLLVSESAQLRQFSYVVYKLRHRWIFHIQFPIPRCGWLRRWGE